MHSSRKRSILSVVIITLFAAGSAWAGGGGGGVPANAAPDAPANMSQVNPNGNSNVIEGGWTGNGNLSIDFSATLTDTNSDNCTLEVEVQNFGVAFTGTATLTSGAVVSGQTATVTYNGASGIAYHWRARAVDSNNATSAWVEFGVAGNMDFGMGIDPLTPPTITTPSGLNPLNVGLSINTSFQATSPGAVTWSHIGGTLPNGLTVATNGVYSGIPNTSGIYTFTLQATNVGGTDTRQFTQIVFNANTLPNTAPGTPTNLGQCRSNGVIPVGAGQTVDESTLTFRALVSDPDSNGVKLQVEVKPAGSPFDGTITSESNVGASGTEICAIVSGLADGGHHWRVRSFDTRGAASGWVAFGGPTDFIVDTTANVVPSSPAGLQQADNVGGIAQAALFVDNDMNIVLRADATDADMLQMVKIQVEVKPVGTPMSSLPTTEGAFATLGTKAFVEVNGLSAGQYHWQARLVDTAGGVSPWTPFGSSDPADADFEITTTGAAPNAPANIAQLQSDALQGIAIGATTNESQVVIRADVSHPAGEAMRLELELQPQGGTFSGQGSLLGSWTGNGPTSITLLGLPDGGYIWQVRTVDTAGRTSPWALLAGNPDFIVDTTGNAPPAVSGLGQFRSDTLTVIPNGGSTNETIVTLKGTVSDTNTGQAAQLFVEVVPNGAVFTGIPSGASGWLGSGVEGQVSVSGLVSGTTYQWRAWAMDTEGLGSPATTFGTFSVTPNAAALDTVNPGQFRLNGVTAIAVGGVSNEKGIIFSGTVEDPDGDAVCLQVEVQPIGQAFVGAPSATSPVTPSGSQASVVVAGLPNFTDYHWQVRTIDSSGAASAWTSFAGNLESEVDFSKVPVPPPPPPPPLGSEGGKIDCSATSAHAGTITLGWMVLVLFGLAILRRRV